jgi:signal transduction histidine kinase
MAQFDAFRSERLHLALHIDQNILSEVNWDARQIELLLNIFVRNAIDALQGRGEIHVTVAKTTMGTAIEAISFFIYDNGPGIAADIKDKIFDPFFTTKKEGSGLGLAFANRIVLQHKGKIILSECPDGACFLIKLPVNPEVLKVGAENA